MVANPIRWTVQDLAVIPDDWDHKRYEIINGELSVTRAPHIFHQDAGDNILFELSLWSRKTGLGKASSSPGLVFTESDAVIPDVVWASNEVRETGIDEAGHFTIAPELVVEVLSSGAENERRDREVKLRLYSLYGVQEYWIVNWRLKTITVYRRKDAQLTLVHTLNEADMLTSPLLPDFECEVAAIF